MTTSMDSFSKTDPFAAAISLQDEHARAYSELADRIRAESPEAASILLTMRQRQQSELRKLMCVYGFSSSKRASNIPPSPALPAAAEGKNSKASGIESSQERELKRKIFILQIVQPGLAGLMDGSVSTLAPVFAAAFATHSTHAAFLVGLAASLGAGISMGFAEALSDDGSLTGRGHPLLRGVVCGAMTALGGIGHTLPFLTSQFKLAIGVAVAVVVVELGVITWVRHRFMETPALSAAMQVAFGGAIVFGAGILIGSW